MHQRVDELLGAYALGAVNRAESEMVRAHLAGCTECTATLAKLTETVGLLPLSLEVAEPPESLFDRVMSVTEERPRVVGAASPAARARSPWGGRQLLPWAAAAAVVLALGGWNVALQIQATRTSDRLARLQNQTVRSTMTAAHGAVAGSVSYFSQDQVALVQLHALTSPPSGRTYELWVVSPSGAATAAGLFLPDPDGSKLLVVSRRLSPGDILAVTVEPLAGSAQPTSAPVITGRL